MLNAFTNIFRIPELRRKVFFTLICLVVYRLGTYIPVPGVDMETIREMAGRGEGIFDELFGFIGMVTGGRFGYLTLFSLGVMPYISASIIFQLLIGVVPVLERLAKEGEAGRKKIHQYERYATVPICLLQGYMQIQMAQRMYAQAVPSGVGFVLMAVLLMTTGSIFLMWIGEQINEFGIGNGISLIIMAGIVARAPSAVRYLFTNFESIGILVVITLAICFVFVVLGIVIITQGQRRIPIQQAKHTRGRRVYGGLRHYLPFRVNQAGVIPIIFASSLLIFPTALLGMLAQAWPSTFERVQDFWETGGFLYIAFYMVLIIFFCFFWTAITFKPDELADNLKEYGSFVPGMRPGKRTADYLEKIMLRITFVGALFLAVIAIVPSIVHGATKVDWVVTSFFGGTGLLIVVGVALDLVEKIESHLLMRHYEGFISKGRIRGRR